jgi:hypothetical protein
VSARVERGVVNVAPVLMGNAAAIDIPSGQSVRLNLPDPGLGDPGGMQFVDTSTSSVGRLICR